MAGSKPVKDVELNVIVVQNVKKLIGLIIEKDVTIFVKWWNKNSGNVNVRNLRKMLKMAKMLEVCNTCTGLGSRL